MMNDTVIKMKSPCRYLGHMITDGLDDNEDIKRQLRSFYGKANMLLLHSITVQLMWKKNCFPLMLVVCILATFGSFTLYGKTGKCMLHIIMFFRRLMGYHKFCNASGMFVENRIDNFDARIRRLVYGFYQRLMCSGNSLVNSVMNSSAWLSSDLYRNWNKCLYVTEMVS